jgi:hypothetical protein
VINIQRIPLAKRAEVRTGLHGNCTFFLPEFKIKIKNAQQ